MTDICLTAGDYGLQERWTAGVRYIFGFTRGGNLELWNTARGHLLWESGTEGKGATRLSVREDGNVVIYGAGNRILWSSDTAGSPGAFVAVQEDGNVVVYSRDHKPLWQSGTSGR